MIYATVPRVLAGMGVEIGSSDVCTSMRLPKRAEAVNPQLISRMAWDFLVTCKDSAKLSYPSS
jgi:hypothetical protein